MSMGGSEFKIFLYHHLELEPLEAFEMARSQVMMVVPGWWLGGAVV